MRYLFLFLTLMASTYADSLQHLEGGDIDFSQQVVQQKVINLDDPFLIQLYTTWKAAGSISAQAEKFMQLVFDKKNEEALKLLPSVNEPKLTESLNAAEIYLLYQTGMVQTMISRWIDYASSESLSPLLTSQIGIGLDQVIAKDSSALLIKNGFFFSDQQKIKLAKIEEQTSRLNDTLQALNALRSGSGATRWIGKLANDDELRLLLSQSAVLQYAKEGKLGASGKILKSVFVPILDQTGNDQQIAQYFLILGRLLYQAGALPEARKYYELIPSSSSYYLQARTEALWVYMREKDFAKVKGEVATFNVGLFDDQFFPDIYLASAFASVMLCEFLDAKNALSRFVTINRNWAKKIEQQLASEAPSPTEQTFFIQNLDRARASSERELKILASTELNNRYEELLKAQISLISESLRQEAKNQWRNRKKILEDALYKMQFVKVELISRMRKLKQGQSQDATDSVGVYSAAVAREHRNQMAFPSDGILWGDEVFTLSAEVKNLCLQGLSK